MGVRIARKRWTIVDFRSESRTTHQNELVVRSWLFSGIKNSWWVIIIQRSGKVYLNLGAAHRISPVLGVHHRLWIVWPVFWRRSVHQGSNFGIALLLDSRYWTGIAATEVHFTLFEVSRYKNRHWKSPLNRCQERLQVCPSLTLHFKETSYP